MKKLFCCLLLLGCLFGVACASDIPSANQIQPAASAPANSLAGEKILVAYFSATNNTKQTAEEIAKATGGDLYRIEAAMPYAANPYDDSERIKQEAYSGLRPQVKAPLTAAEIAQYDVIFIGSPIWWHQPAMVVCSFLESYDLSGKTIVPFFTYGARTYLNEAMQRIYKSTPNSSHVPALLPTDLEPDNIQQAQADDDGIIMPADLPDIRAWLRALQLQ